MKHLRKKFQRTGAGVREKGPRKRRMILLTRLPEMTDNNLQYESTFSGSVPARMKYGTAGGGERYDPCEALKMLLAASSFKKKERKETS